MFGDSFILCQGASRIINHAGSGDHARGYRDVCVRYEGMTVQMLKARGREWILECNGSSVSAVGKLYYSLLLVWLVSYIDLSILRANKISSLQSASNRVNTKWI